MIRIVKLKQSCTDEQSDEVFRKQSKIRPKCAFPFLSSSNYRICFLKRTFSFEMSIDLQKDCCKGTAHNILVLFV